jgi:signal transduction protein with GAF and PtsI domain
MMSGERVTEGHPEYHQWYTRPVGTGLTGYIIENKHPILIDQNAEKTLEKLGLPFMQFGEETHSWLGVPMIIGERVLGVISVQAAVAINNTRLFNQEQERAKQERTVRTITDKVRRGENIQNIMQIALEELSQVLNADVSSIQLGNQEQLLAAQQKIKKIAQPIKQNGNEGFPTEEE